MMTISFRFVWCVLMMLCFISCGFIGNENRFSCNLLPDKTIVDRTLSTNKATQKSIEGLEINVINVVVETHRECTDKAFIVIYYATIQQRQQIEEMLGDTFFGIPYKMINI